jgi:hypothetical protein
METQPPLKSQDLRPEARPATRGDIRAVIVELREIHVVLREIRTLLEKQNKSGD